MRRLNRIPLDTLSVGGSMLAHQEAGREGSTALIKLDGSIPDIAILPRLGYSPRPEAKENVGLARIN